MRREKKSAGRWIGEAVLIFLSVFGAFQLDDYRETKNQESNFIRHLKDFKSDLTQNQGKFNYELRKTYDRRSGEGYILGSIKKYEFLDSLMSIPTRRNADTLMAIIKDDQIFGITRWIFESPQYEPLNRNFYSFFRNDSLRSRLQMHHRNDQSRVDSKSNIQRYVDLFHSIEDELDLRVGGTPANRAVLFSNKSVNTMTRLTDSYYRLRSMTMAAKQSDSLLLIQVDHELRLWGELD